MIRFKTFFFLNFFVFLFHHLLRAKEKQVLLKEKKQTKKTFWEC